MEGNFVSLNLIDKKTNKALIDYPVIYFWNAQESLETLFEDESLKNMILSKVGKESYFTSSVFLIYVFENSEEELEYFEKEYKVSDLYKFPLSFVENLIYDVLNYLYKCAYKEDPEKMSIDDLYEKIRKKHPDKVNENIVAKYIIVRLSEKYPDIPNDIIEQASNIFLNRRNDI